MDIRFDIFDLYIQTLAIIRTEKMTEKEVFKLILSEIDQIVESKKKPLRK